MTLQRAVIELPDSEVAGKSNLNPEFHLVGNLSVTEQIRPDYLLSDELSNTNAVFQNLLGNPVRRGIFKDEGAGSHVFEMQFTGWEGATDAQGNDVTWGDPNESEGTVWNATGANPVRQMNVFMHHFRETTNDSFDPAVLRTGEWDSSGLSNLADKLYVAPQSVRITHVAEDFSTIDGAFTFIEVERADIVIDAFEAFGFP